MSIIARYKIVGKVNVYYVTLYFINDQILTFYVHFLSMQDHHLYLIGAKMIQTKEIESL